MFEITKFKLDGFEVISIGKKNGPRFELIPEKGGSIHQLFLNSDQIPVFTPFEGEEDVRLNPKYKQSILFPFPNRLKDGKYSFNGKNYQFPINEHERNNALHGLLYDRKLEISELDLKEASGLLELIYIYHGNDEYYPFPFTIRLQYYISETEFKLTCVVENTGNGDLPYGFGWHPYFKTNYKAKLLAPESMIQDVDNRLLPTGTESTYNWAFEISELDVSLDNAFRIKEGGSFEIHAGMFQGKILKMVADKSFKFFQIYNPEQDVIAIEPVTANIDALNNEDGIIILPPGESRQHKVGLSLS